MSLLRDKYGVVVTVSVISLVLDQMSKAAIIARFSPGQTLPLVPGWLELFHAHNHDSAFGLIHGNSAIFFVVISALVIGLVGLYFLRLRRDDVWQATALALIVGGALGNNILDRLRHGFVIDFIRFYRGSWSWPTFNLADIFIVCGVAMFAVDLIRGEKQARRPTAKGRFVASDHP
jgi:signal peptidase II